MKIAAVIKRTHNMKILYHDRDFLLGPPMKCPNVVYHSHNDTVHNTCSNIHCSVVRFVLHNILTYCSP